MNSSKSVALNLTISRRSYSGRRMSGATLLLSILLVSGLTSTFADPGPISFALGGLEFRKEPRISMLNEKLTIGTDEEAEGGPPAATMTLTFRVTSSAASDGNRS